MPVSAWMTRSPELAALHALVDGDVLDVADAAEVARELLLHEDGAHADYGVRCTRDDNDGEIGVGA